MKKILWFLTTLLGIACFHIPSVEAQTAQFYEAEYIPNVYIVRERNGVRYYQQGRFFRNTVTQELAYCLQPFSSFDANATYDVQEKLAALDDETTNKLKAVVAFGYPFINSDPAYYIATQLKIWQILEPNDQFYFTKGLNGPKTTDYDYLLRFIDNTINVYNQTPEFANQIYTTTVNGDVSLNMPLSNYYEDIIETELSYERHYDTVTFKNLKAGDYTIKVTRKYQNVSNTPMLFYYHQNSQWLMNRGLIEDKHYTFQIKVVDTSIHVIKVDADTKTKKPSGEASLQGAVFSLYQGKEKIATITFDESLEAMISVSNKTIDYLPFGTYTLKEEKAGKGYLCNDKEIEITLDATHPNIEIVLENKVIQNKVTIQKFYGTKQIIKSESNVLFEIYDKDGNIIKTIMTDQDGKCIFYLPFGKYTIHQKTTIEGYQKVEDFDIEVKEDQKEHHFTLYDQEIPKEEKPQEPTVEIEVPDTSAKAISPFFIIGAIAGLSYVQKKNRM